LLRKESGLPLLSVAQEFRRQKRLESAEAYAKFAERYRGRVQEKVLAGIRKQMGDENWKPRGFFGGMGLQREISERLGRLYARIG
jgi:hypothetical protein